MPAAVQQHQDDTVTRAHMPKTESTTEKVLSPIVTVSSHTDPWPHYLMSAACGGASLYYYSSLNNPRSAAIKAGLGLAYLYAGRQLVGGNPTLGYDVGLVSSLALTGVTAPGAMTPGVPAVQTALAALGGMSAIANLLKSYQLRTGAPKEMDVRREQR